MTAIRIVPILAALSFPLSFAWAGEGHDVGNGGGAWVCRKNDAKRTVVWADLLDFHEEWLGGNRTPDRRGTEPQILDQLEDRIGRSSPRFWSMLQPHWAEVLAKWPSPDESGAALARTADFVSIRMPDPSTCKGSIEAEQVANFGFDGELRVNQALFDALTPTRKAALKLHEAVYSLLRTSKGVQEDSPLSGRREVARLARIVTGAVAGQSPEQDLAGFLEKRADSLQADEAARRSTPRKAIYDSYMGLLGRLDRLVRELNQANDALSSFNAGVSLVSHKMITRWNSSVDSQNKSGLAINVARRKLLDLSAMFQALPPSGGTPEERQRILVKLKEAKASVAAAAQAQQASTRIYEGVNLSDRDANEDGYLLVIAENRSAAEHQVLEQNNRHFREALGHYRALGDLFAALLDDCSEVERVLR